jgi:hypothetical protein
MKFQVTLFSTTGKYRPMACVLDAPSPEDFEKNFNTVYKKKAIQKIAGQRYRDGKSLLQSGYTQIKWRIYDEQERKEYNKKKFLENFQKTLDKRTEM